MPKQKADTKSLPLSDTLRDLAILRAADIDVASYLPPSTAEQQAEGQIPPDASSGKVGEKDDVVAKSYEFVREARAAIRILHGGEVNRQGARVDEVRNGLEDILNGLEAEQSLQ